MILASHAYGDQVHQAFFRLRILFENLQIQRGRLVEFPEQLQRNRFTEQRRLVVGMLGQDFVEIADRRLRLFLVQQADAEPEISFFALRIDLDRFLECFGRFLPAAQLFIADAEVEISRGMARRGLQQLLVSLDGVVVLFQLELNMPLRREDLGGLFAGFDSRIQFFQRFLALAFQVQRNRLRQRRRDCFPRGAKSCAVH